MRSLSLLLFIMTLTSLASCGQTGPLYLPSKTTPPPPSHTSNDNHDIAG